ncbi:MULTISPECIES: DUF397 domain-containing protein [Streptomyces]|uniref:DUF397 domain-containing protein n=1 Tax=Streptomyces TaxID=1883 RepID=UPI00207137C2|nr:MULTISPECIES: DUF397 domain-containing protein [Streptomyces]UPT44083.1 DUF397 domain-containing protein [Streptomyces sp. WAC00303]WIY78256.1 DUF397 domain-containing protein [Streptomyces anulatus]
MSSTELNWFKSSYSTNDGPSCVEVAAAPTTIHVRDSKQLPTGGPHLGFGTAAWADFVTYASEA